MAVQQGWPVGEEAVPACRQDISQGGMSEGRLELDEAFAWPFARWWLGAGCGDIPQCAPSGGDLVSEQFRLATEEFLMLAPSSLVLWYRTCMAYRLISLT